MKKILLIIVILLGLYGNYKNKVDNPQIEPPNNHFECDGRVYCSDMKSYEEAKFFVDNCPNTKMDGDHDGEPCESQFSN